MSSATKGWRSCGDERGSAIVEMVFVVPLLVLILFAIVELSRAWLTLQIATSAAREGARAASVSTLGNEVTNGEARIDALLSNAGLTATSRSVVKQALAGTPDFEVVSTVNLTFTPMLPVGVPTMSLVETASMRYECNPAITPCSPPP